MLNETVNKSTKSMKMMTTSKSLELFGVLFSEGVNKIQEACEVYVSCIDKDILASDKFKEKFPHIPSNAWNRFENVGRHLILPELLTDTTPMAEKLKRLPISVQKRMYGKSQQLITKTGDILNVSFHHATKEQARQMIANDHIRPLAEQRAWLEDRKIVAVKKEVTFDKVYEVKNHKLVIFEACSFNKDQLIQLLADI